MFSSFLSSIVKKLLHLGPRNFVCHLGWCGLRLCQSLDQNGALGDDTPMLPLWTSRYRKIYWRKIEVLGRFTYRTLVRSFYLIPQGRFWPPKFWCLGGFLIKLKFVNFGPQFFGPQTLYQNSVHLSLTHGPVSLNNFFAP